MENLELELTKASVEILKNATEDIIRPSTKTIGKNIASILDGTIGWFGAWGESQKLKQQLYLAEFKQQLENKLEQIQEENLIEPEVKILGPVLESARYYYEDKYYSDMFSSLIASACDKSKQQNIHPAFSSIIQQLSPLDAKVLSMFNYQSSFASATLKENHSNGKISYANYILIDFEKKNSEFPDEEFIKLTASIDNLTRLNLINKRSDILQLNYDYNNFNSTLGYKIFSAVTDKTSNIEIVKQRIELTTLGGNFLNICMPK